MIMTRTPFRISFAGGGTDLEAFYSQHGGMVLSTAINKYMYLAVNERFGNTFRVSYSRTELADQRGSIQHPIVRACLEELGIREGLEIVSIADLPAQSGMASSSSFTVGLLHALHAMRGHTVSPHYLAEEACKIEINRLHEPIGKQDQYITAYGGIRFIQFQRGGEVFVDPVICNPSTLAQLQQSLCLFFTGTTRDAREVLSKQSRNVTACTRSLTRLCDIAQEMRSVLTTGRDLDEFGILLNEAWQSKKALEATISNSRIDEYYARGLQAGALGGKLLGAGSGGFLLFFCNPGRKGHLRQALADLTEVPFCFEPEGTKVIHVGSDRLSPGRWNPPLETFECCTDTEMTHGALDCVDSRP